MQGRLSVARVRAVNTPGLHADGGTLYRHVAPGGSKQWIQRLVIRGKRHDLGLGGFPLVTLAEARETAYENRRLARKGGDPLAANGGKRHPIFKKAAKLTYDALRPRWRSAKAASNWWAHLEPHAFPRLGDKRVDLIDGESVLQVLTPICTAKPETARRVCRNIKATLKWRQTRGWRSNRLRPALPGGLH